MTDRSDIDMTLPLIRCRICDAELDTEHVVITERHASEEASETYRLCYGCYEQLLRRGLCTEECI